MHGIARLLLLLLLLPAHETPTSGTPIAEKSAISTRTQMGPSWISL